MIEDSIARAPEVEKFYKGRLVTIMQERGRMTTDSIFFRYYIDGKAGYGFSTPEIALKAAKIRIDPLPSIRCEA